MDKNKKRKVATKEKQVTLIMIIIMMVIFGCYAEIADRLSSKNASVNYTTEENEINENTVNTVIPSNTIDTTEKFDVSNIPKYFGKAYIELNGNKPYFSEDEKIRTDEFENYTKIDEYGRRGIAYMNVCKNMLPPKDESRGNIESIRPSGMQYQTSYSVIPGGYLYNRSHLIAVQLGGDDVEKRNIIVGTKQLNTEMMSFEKRVRTYINNQVKMILASLLSSSKYIIVNKDLIQVLGLHEIEVKLTKYENLDLKPKEEEIVFDIVKEITKASNICNDDVITRIFDKLKARDTLSIREVGSKPTYISFVYFGICVRTLQILFNIFNDNYNNCA